MYLFDVSTQIWTELRGTDMMGPVPSARYGHGFVASSGMLYVFGGTCGDFFYPNGRPAIDPNLSIPAKLNALYSFECCVFFTLFLVLIYPNFTILDL